MILRSLKIQSVKCFEDAEITFVPGKNVIVGHNGSGKSTILQSILYSLYGIYPHEKRNLEGLVRRGERVGEFELEFEQDGKEFLVKRTLRRSGLPEAYFFEAGIDEPKTKTQSGVTATVTETLGIKRDVFRNVVFVRQGEIAKIIQDSGSDRRNLFDKLLGIHDYEQAWSKCNNIIKSLSNIISSKQEIIDVYGPIADKLSERKRSLRKLKEKQKTQRTDLSTEKKNLQKTNARWKILDELSRRIVKLETRLEGKREELEKEEGNLSQYSTDAVQFCDDLSLKLPKQYTSFLVKIQEELTETDSKIQISRGERDELKEKKTTLRNNETAIIALGKDIQSFADSIGKTRLHITEKFPSLADELVQSWPAIIEQERVSCEGRIENLEKSLGRANSLSGKVENLRERIKTLKDGIKGFNEEIDKIKETASTEGGIKWMSLAKLKPTKLKTELKRIENLQSETKELHDIAERAVTKKNVSIERTRKDIRDLSSLSGKKCPKCKQVVDEQHLTELEQDLSKDLKDSVKSLKGLQTEQSRLAEELQRISSEESKTREKIQLVTILKIHLGNFTKLQNDRKKKQVSMDKLVNKLKGFKEELDAIDLKSLESERKTQGTRLSTLIELKIHAEGLPKIIFQKREKEDALEVLERATEELRSISITEKIDSVNVELNRLEPRSKKLSGFITTIGLLLKSTEAIKKINSVLERDNSTYAGLQAQYNPSEHKKIDKEKGKLTAKVGSIKESIRIITDEQLPDASQLFIDSFDAKQNLENVTDEHQKAISAKSIIEKVREFFREVQKPLRRKDTVIASRHASEIFRELIGSNEFDRVKISEDHELYVSRYGTLEPMTSLSGGEQVLASLSVRLGFARALANSDLLILDEPTAYLDDKRRAELVEVLNRTSPAKQILIVTHDDSFEQIAQNVIRTQKDDTTLISQVG